MKKLKSYLNNEQGNIALFVIGLIGVMIILFMLVLNLAGALIVKEQVMSTSQQAALAATSALYEELPGFISDYEKYLKELLAEEAGEGDSEGEAPEEEAPAEEDTIAELIEKETDRLAGDMADYSLNEIRNEAIDRVLSSEMDKGLGGGLLKKMMSEEMEYSWVASMKESARNTILANGGELAGAQMTVFENGQIVVESSKEASAIGYNGFFAGAAESLYKSSKGPEVNFVQKLPGWDSRTYSLE